MTTMTTAVNSAQVLELLLEGKALSDDQADGMFEELLSGNLGQAAAGAFLMGLRAKGEDSTDLAAGVRAGLKHARQITGLSGPRIDTCGTGGDGKNSFNCSTATALFLADMGHQVVKHGNRAVSSSCGSADALEALGCELNTEPEQVAAELDRNHFVFLFAPAYHPAFKHIAPVRQGMGIRTLFNFMGPLLNPARPTHQLLGVSDPDMLNLMGETLLLTGVERALLIHGAGGYDELTTFGPARGYYIEKGRMDKTVVDPVRLGFRRFSPEAVEVEGKEHAVAVLRDILKGRGPEPMMQMVALNLAACLHILGEGDMESCSEVARDYVKGGLRRGEVAC
ncbi:anthranilate phosphoribosyltransferase [Paucidesulfovibrio gracilis DSM 16080]|uniref:Anthranilate phosphoribosyltransferase n=2 Tax=Paucidesulfovibrio TaxID=2910985 RepID=A0A1T4W4H1_9BACT|nr:anthranilate phosphoribosyltransferase [Paucidesulfovibrio gracilis]SKA71935.1 anthranilate phosphoribosyltransferase [Paucidesulfovibrio gracilis DSM 16080]